MDIFSFLTTCRALALDGADIHMSGLKNTTRPHLKEVRRRALDMGLSDLLSGRQHRVRPFGGGGSEGD